MDVGWSEDGDGLNGLLWDLTLSDILAGTCPDNQKRTKVCKTFSTLINNRLRSSETKLQQVFSLELRQESYSLASLQWVFVSS